MHDRHSYDLEKRAAPNCWGKRIEAIVANKKGTNWLDACARVTLKPEENHAERIVEALVRSSASASWLACDSARRYR